MCLLYMRELIHSDKFLPYNPELVSLAQKLRRSMTKQERQLWYKFLRYRKPPFYRQRPIYHYIVDFYQPANKLVIELDGSQHGMKDGIEADKERDAVLGGLGLTVLRFWNQEVDNNFSGVCEKILEYSNTPFI